MDERIIKYAITVVACFFFVVVLAWVWQTPADYYYTFLPATQRWLGGQTGLYDAQSVIFYNAPWMLGLVMPFANSPLVVGQIALDFLSLICAVTAVAVFWDGQHFSIALLAVASLPVLFLLNNCQIDGILLLGIAIGYLGIIRRKPWLLSAAFVMLLIKPPNVLLPIVLFAWAARNWSKRDWLCVVTFPSVAILASGIQAGLDWPLRYIEYSRNAFNVTSVPAIISIWRAADQLRLPYWLVQIAAVGALVGCVYIVYREGFNLATLSLAITADLVFTNYAMEYHYVLLIPAFLYVARSWITVLLIYPLSFLIFVRLVAGWEASWVYIIYPISHFAAVWARVWSQSRIAKLPFAENPRGFAE